MLDVLRAVATVRVVLYHSSGDPRWSWFAAMPAMFFVGGALYAKSLDRRPSMVVLRHRLRRILVPMWAWSAFVFLVYTVNGSWGRVPGWGIPGFILPITPPVGPQGLHDPLHWTWMALWYLNAYIVFMIIGIPLRRLQQKHPVAIMAVLAVPIVVSGIAGPNAVAGLTSNLVFWLLGYWYHDHRHRMPSRRTLGGVGLVATVIALGYGAAVTGQWVIVTSDPFLNAAVGVAWVALALALAPGVERVAALRPVDVVVTWIQQRALTIYLWHALATGIVIEWALHNSTFDSGWTRVAAVFVLTFLIVLATGWIEDVAAERRAKVWPLEPRTIDLVDRPVDLTERGRSIGQPIRVHTDEVARGA
jgi:peptidoglycan/LPS O-acetylase OafA/YrhL